MALPGLSEYTLESGSRASSVQIGAWCRDEKRLLDAVLLAAR